MPTSVLRAVGTSFYSHDRLQQAQVSKTLLPRPLRLVGVCACKAADSVKLRSAGNWDLGNLMPRGKILK